MSMSISFFDFKNLSTNEQYKMADSYGIIVNKRESQDLIFITYEFDFFSVEITYAVRDHKFAALNAYQHKFEKAMFI
ncbi:hypothetical protein [uncultured Chryseobacterium sp.]|uniref:hypothetical protein n=1 Tax=uncultured Chryseobacterium sp. TaxID=259322 RepID=UPI0025CB9A7F|nr:hypothetical protein [uncultured Chryseobacterium sp.]